ncbi:hypothetical protein [uncultured Roseobacter sp.]|uniref:hypothetical protein n=1 Tax=uncultured Roseobacter sp. TaxID=114847 RepID=UPI0026198685|nr:hypothetical protein [uncultured Roseobacter sp.]
MCSAGTDPHWIEYVRALGPIIIGVAVAYIAYMQWKLAKSSLDEKLFDRRYAIISFAKRVAQQAGLAEEREQRQNEFEVMQRLDEAKYLFSLEIHTKLRDLVQASRAIRRLERREIRSAGSEAVEEIRSLNQEMDASQERIGELFQKIDQLTSRWMTLGGNK